MALKAERREGREEGREEGRKEGFAAGMISICREMGHMEDQEIIRVLMKEMHVSRDKAAEYLAGYEASDPGG
jgi:flagellar biosynthesis/type III secretory pathway protein FliH